MNQPQNPDCRDGKHAACRGGAWDFEVDEPVACSCDCHRDTHASSMDEIHAERAARRGWSRGLLDKISEESA